MVDINETKFQKVTVVFKYDNKTMIAASTVYSIFQCLLIATNRSGIDPDESDNYEIGYRSRSANSFLEVVAFFVDYDNLNETCSIASGCGNASNSQTNAGEAESRGLEITYKVERC